jgi:hypothetical protein
LHVLYVCHAELAQGEPLTAKPHVREAHARESARPYPTCLDATHARSVPSAAAPFVVACTLSSMGLVTPLCNARARAEDFEHLCSRLR